jgi:RimJ/RimL family protein N-acetyltransferase
MKIEPLTLNGEYVRLEPLRIEHHAALCEAGLSEEIWRLSPTQIDSPEAMKKYIVTALEEQKCGAALPFVTIEKTTDKIVGSTRFGNIDVANRRAEIGWTWISPSWQRTYVNSEAKLLMLVHAFETWQCIRVEFKTDVLNEKSRNAILRLGARQEGIFRQHIVCASGRLRDSVYFSILDSEWQSVKENLLQKLGKT